MILAVFPSDIDYANRTWVGRVHTLVGNFTFVLVPLCLIIFGYVFKKDPHWGNFWSKLSYLLAGVGLLCSGVMKILQIYDGLFERLGVGADLLWIFLVSINLKLLEGRRRLLRLWEF